ncbi:tetratricopeptide repeat protein 8-like isoform X2 [Paramacrobiotus metropolitanus]|uniref:tetratricopeptide repeat protein 8-like isoform X2 n=1 Tax=Paramacrobiotus metropolitanus TaxID=2943436 RepID=UPI002445C510|nr:tetratricopeptide repeat protein 8-like isoform X2 [Paramacrobiotus metropolitanus]
MDPLFVCLRLFDMRKYDDVNKITTALLERNPQDEAAWTLKMRALTQQVYIDEYEMEYDGAVDQLMDESAMAANPKPGTSLRQTAKPGPGAGARPMSRRTGRPVSGMLRPSSRTVTGLGKVTTGRAVSGQPLSAKIGRMLRQGTASMITSPNGPFINLSRLNLTKYSQKKYLAKALFEYIFYHDHETSMGLQMANEGVQVDDKDWWWHRARALCHYRLALYREAEKDIREAMKLQAHPEHFLYLAKIYAKIDLPIQAIETYKSGRLTFPMEPAMLIGAARILEDMDDLTNSSLYYRDALKIDAMNFEALACVGMENYYADQPELALRYYRRILQMGAHSPEVFINVGMCCFVSHQMDLWRNGIRQAMLPACCILQSQQCGGFGGIRSTSL